MKLGNKLKKITVLLCALLIALLSTVVVYATVTYDSSQDPIVSFSGMTSYVGKIVDDINTTIATLSTRLGVLETAYATGGSATGGGGSVNLEAYQNLIDRISSLETKLSGLETANADLSNKLTAAQKDYRGLIADLQVQYDAVSASLTSLEGRITNLENKVTAVKTDVSTLQTNFKQISDISTELNTLKYKINALTAAGGDITKLKTRCDELQTMLDSVIDKVGASYEVVLVPYGATVMAKDDADTVLVVLRSGSAVAISTYSVPGTMQGLNDLSDGNEIYDGEQLILFHNVMIPRGGNDGRGVKVTSIDGAYLMIGGDYIIVTP